MKPSVVSSLKISVFFSVILYIVYRFLNADLGLFLALTSLIFYLKEVQDKQVAAQDARMDRVELILVSRDEYREEYHKLLEDIIRLKAGQDLIKHQLDHENASINQTRDTEIKKGDG